MRKYVTTGEKPDSINRNSIQVLELEKNLEVERVPISPELLKEIIKEQKEEEKPKNNGIDIKEVWEKHKASKPQKTTEQKEEENEELIKNILLQEKEEQEIENLQEGEINWLDDDYWDSWDKIKGKTKKILGHHETYDLDDKIEPFKKIFLAHSRDTIYGKAQLVIPIQIEIPLIREIVKKIDEEDDNKNKIKKNLFKYMFYDEKVDGRTEGYQRDQFQKYFRYYKVVDKEDKQYLIFSNQKLPNCSCEFKGMIMDMEAPEELTKSFKIKGITKIFLMKDFVPSVKVLTKEQIVNFTKERKIDEKYWRDFIDYHPNGNLNRCVPEFNDLKDSQILSGKLDGTGQNVFVMGLPGTKKSMGILETLDYKFNEVSNILEGGNSRIKMLTPSFKEKPANLGYLAKAERMGFIDEIGKMVEFEVNKHQTQVNNILGECNFLLDNKERIVGSGNDNECKVQATAKFIKVTNPVSSKRTIYSHVGLIDPTFLSRCMVWVQDEKETAFAQSQNSIEKVPPTPKELYRIGKNEGIDKNNKNNINILVSVGGNRITSREEFLTIFDTCNSFVCELDDEKVYNLVDEVTTLAKEPMKSSVWKPRAYHHVYLLIDGLVKRRCLFKDYDSTFTPKQEDYDLAERILIRMVRGWDTNLTPKEEFR